MNIPSLAKSHFSPFGTPEAILLYQPSVPMPLVHLGTSPVPTIRFDVIGTPKPISEYYHHDNAITSSAYITLPTSSFGFSLRNSTGTIV